MSSQPNVTPTVDLTFLDGSEDALAALAEQAALERVDHTARATHEKADEPPILESGETAPPLSYKLLHYLLEGVSV